MTTRSRSLTAGLLLLAACRSPRIPSPTVCALGQLEDGMTRYAVEKQFGAPDDIYTGITGKVFAPFYFGRDAAETILYYHGLGRVVLASSAFQPMPTVYKVACDPTEPGHRRR